MVNPIDSNTNTFVYATSQKSKSTQSSSATATYTGDVVDISDKAMKLLEGIPEGMRADSKNMEMVRASQQREAAESEPASAWKLAMGGREGKVTLENGNVQTVSIKDGNLEVMEYRNGKLIKSVTGTLSESGASLDTEFYDASGKITQSIHTDITELQGKDGWTSANMSRSVKWFDGSKLIGEMQDNMLLDSWDSVNGGASVDQKMAKVESLVEQGSASVSSNVEDLSKILTTEKHLATYYANVKEYGENGKLSRNITLEHEGKYVHASNRDWNRKLAGMDERSTKELAHDTGMIMEVRDYDSNGDLLREARFSDDQQDGTGPKGGKQEQSMSVSWYSKGELVKRSHGSMTLEETATAGLHNRPGFLETMGLSTEQYLGKDPDNPQSAMDLMTANTVEAASEAEFFTEAIVKHVGANDYSTAEDIASNGSPEQPYSINWTDEIYKDGELVMRQEDREEARKTDFYHKEKELEFHTGRALTENDAPSVIRKTSHEREVFENGDVTSHQFFEARESVEVRMGAADKLITNSVMVDDKDTTAIKSDGGLETVDAIPNAAAAGMSNEIELTLDAFYDTFGSMNAEDMSKRAKQQVSLDYISSGEAAPSSFSPSSHWVSSRAS